jgi:hypothetical protein
VAAADDDDIEFLGIEHGGSNAKKRSTLDFTSATKSAPESGCCAIVCTTIPAPFPENALTDLQALLSSALRAECPPWPADADAAALLRLAETHGVVPLLHARLADVPWPMELREEIRKRCVGRAMWELRHQQVLTHALQALAVRGILPVILKGTSLAFWLYPNPVLRTRGDTDLLVPEEARLAAQEALDSSGFRRNLAIEGESVSYQSSHTHAAVDGTSHTIDLHWKINNSEVLSRLFTYRELRDGAIPLPALSAHAMGTSPVHSMLIACMHRSTHRHNPYYVAGEAHHEPDRLIWLADIHLLAQRMSPAEWDVVSAAARQKGLGRNVADGLARSMATWGTRIPHGASFRSGAEEGSASRYLSATPNEQWKMDWNARRGWTTRWRWLAQTLLPSSEYMRRRYPDVKPQWMAWLYCRRAILGVLKRLRVANDKTAQGR